MQTAHTSSDRAQLSRSDSAHSAQHVSSKGTPASTDDVAKLFGDANLLNDLEKAVARMPCDPRGLSAEDVMKARGLREPRGLRDHVFYDIACVPSPG